MPRFFMAISLAAAMVSAGPIYNVVPIPVAGFIWVDSLSNNGWISGFISSSNQTYVTNGSTTYFYPGTSTSYVNGSGQVASSVFANGVYSASVGTAGVWTALNQPFQQTFSYGISENGTVAGLGSENGNSYGVVWSNGTYELVPGTFQIRAISRSGQAIFGLSNVFTGGYAGGYLRVNGAVTLIDSQGVQFDPLAVNNSGNFVARIWQPDGLGGVTPRAAFGNSAGHSFLPLPSGQNAWLGNQPLNNANQVVFATYGGNGVINQAYLWDSQLGVRNLSDLAGIPVQLATAINDAGQIAAYSNGQFFILDPISQVPEPTTLTLLGAAGLALALRRQFTR